MKKIIAMALVLSMILSMSAMAATKEYDHSGDIPEDDVAFFYEYPIAQNATRTSPWYVRWIRQKQVEFDTGRRAGDGNQMIMAIESSPVNPDHILMGTDMAGLWRSTDGGINWETVGGNNNNWCVNDFEWSPTDENVAFSVQTGSRSDTNGTKANASDLDGIYKTQDAGKTWKLVLGKNVISRAASNDIVQYDKNGNVIALTSEGIFISKNDGETWDFHDNSVIPANSSVFDMKLMDGTTKEMMIAITGGLYYTNSNGLFWTCLNPDLEGITWCTSVTIDPNDENHWYACFQGLKRTLFETKDSGKTWIEHTYPMNSSGHSTPYVVRYMKKADGTSRLFMIYNQCGSPIQYTDDNGEKWNVPRVIERELVYNHQGKGYFVEGFCIDKVNPGTVYYSCADTVYKSTDYGESFDYRNSGYSGINARNVVFDAENRVWFADVDRGLAVSNEPYEQGKYSTVERKIITTECSTVAIDPNDINHIMAFCGGFQESFDRGETWTKNDSFGGEEFRVIHYHNKVKNFIYAGNKYSTDNGKNWKDLQHKVSAVSPVNNDVIYSNESGLVSKSKDRGKTWEEVYNGGGSLYYLIADVEDEDTFWCGMYNGSVIKIEGTAKTVYHTDNGLYTDKGSFVSIMAMAQNPKNPKHLVVGGKETKGGLKTPGLFETLDGGETWRVVPGMNGIAHIVSLNFSPVSNEVFVGTCSNGLMIYDYKVFDDWYNGKLTSWDKSDEYIIPNMYTDGRIRVKIDSDVIGFDSQPFLENDRTFVPMRKIFEKLGATIEWDEETETVTGTKGDTVVKLTIGKNVATVNGVEKTLDAVPQLKKERTMIPLRFVAEALGCKVDWSDSNNLVIIKSK